MYPFSDFEKVAFEFYEGLNCSTAERATQLLARGEYDQLVDLRADPKHYGDPASYFCDAQASDFLRKSPDLPTSHDRVEAAEKLFLESEAQCARTNALLSRVNNGYHPDDLTRSIADFLRRVRRKVSDVLGPVPRHLNGARHGPGATFGNRAPLTTAPDKMSSIPTVTSSARCLLPLWGQTAWARALYRESPNSSEPETVRGNRFTVVNKDATKGRGIAIEPSINVYYQLGVGAEMRRLLKRVGWDLDLGQETHREMAQHASLFGDYCTIDLSSASDTVCIELVRACLPAAWFELLSSLRSPMTLFKGRWHHLSKFSSMGNGFTFELETLLFGAIAQVVSDCYHTRGSKKVLAYGDDIIVSVESAPSLMQVLNVLGFTPNVRKTFVEGDFKESCGGDFFRGVAVRPYLVEELPRDPQQWISLHNGIYKTMLMCKDFGVGNEGAFRRALGLCVEMIPRAYRHYGPSRLGDLVLHAPFRVWRRATWVIDGIVWGKVVRPIPHTLQWEHWKPLVVLASALMGCPQEGVTPRKDGKDQVSGFRVGVASFS